MKAVAIASLALLAGAPEPQFDPASGPRHYCVPPPERTTPRQIYDPVDKWQRDQRTIA